MNKPNMITKLGLLLQIAVAITLISLIPMETVDAKAFMHGIKLSVDGEEYYLDGPADAQDGAKDIPGHYWVIAGHKQLVGKHYNSGPFDAPQWWSSDAPDGAFLYNVHGIIDTWSDDKAEKFFSRGYVHYHELVRVSDGRPHPDKVVWLKHTARMKFTLDGGPRPDLAHAVRPGVDYEFIPYGNEPYPSLQQQVAIALWNDVFDFELVELDMNELSSDLELGNNVSLPVAAPDTDIMWIEELPSSIVALRPGLFYAYQKMSQPHFPDIRVELPMERNYRVGDCTLMEKPLDISSCGALTILDEGKTMISGLVMIPEIGMSFLEPVDMILGGREYPGIHIVYNSKNTVNPITEEEEPPLPPNDDDQFGLFSSFTNQIESVISFPYYSSFTTNIVLDGDQQFYDIDPSTVWQRMDAVYNAVDLVYTHIEPWSWDWGLQMNIKGMEVWVNGGPTTTDKVGLTDELVDPNYYLIHPVTDEEIHFFSVGYNVSGVYGRAAGIGYSGSNAIGGSSGNNHAYSEALTTQSLKTKWVVAAHEIGHLIGGQHGDGAQPSSDECAGGWWALFGLKGSQSLCAPSLMPAGSAGAPDGRSAFFSDANDANIIDTLNAVGL